MLLILAIVLSLTACGPELESGTVIDKKHIPSRVVVQCIPVGKMVIPQYVTIPAQYKILVQGTDAEGAAKTEWWNLNLAAYSRICIGMEVKREADDEIERS